MKKVCEKDEVERKDLTVKIEELNLVNDTCIKELKKLRSSKQVRNPHVLCTVCEVFKKPEGGKWMQSIY